MSEKTKNIVLYLDFLVLVISLIATPLAFKTGYVLGGMCFALAFMSALYVLTKYSDENIAEQKEE